MGAPVWPNMMNELKSASVCKANIDSKRLERWVCDGDATVFQHTLVSILVSFLLLIYQVYSVLILRALMTHHVINV